MEQSPADKKHYTAEEYFALLEQSEEKFEYHRGEVSMMAGRTSNHTIIAANMSRRVLEGLDDKDCIGYGSDMKMDIACYDCFLFPDASAVCGPLEFAEQRNDAIKNPSLLVEVLSPSTEGYDRGLKFKMYRSLPSFKEYVLISQDEPLVEVFTRQNSETWSYHVHQGLDTGVTLTAIEHTIKLKDIYQKVTFEEQPLEADHSQTKRLFYSNFWITSSPTVKPSASALKLRTTR